MRCKVNDLAVVTNPRRPENYGAIVEVIAPSVVPGLDWLVRSKGRGLMGFPVLGTAHGPELRRGRDCNFRDSQLRPLRPDEGIDESLNWAERPQEIA